MNNAICLKCGSDKNELALRIKTMDFNNHTKAESQGYYLICIECENEEMLKMNTFSFHPNENNTTGKTKSKEDLKREFITELNYFLQKINYGKSAFDARAIRFINEANSMIENFF